jgi:hypothetical protein
MKRTNFSSRPCTIVCFVGIALFFITPLTAQTVPVDAAMSNQTLEGWGTSLAWFANSVGGWTNTTNQNNLMQSLFSPTSGLGLNYLRYNIGGGDDPLCGTGSPHYACISPTYHATPGYEPSGGSYNWSQDANQRWVAQNAQTIGANLFEAVSYSPPYWMTNSGTSEGGVSGAVNIAPAYYGSGSGTFADYLTTVAQHFNSSWGITFHHLEPLNESGQSYWTAGDTKQEGSGGLTVANQESVIQGTATSLTSKGLVTQVAAMDEYQEGYLNATTKTTAYEFHNYDATTMNAMSALNTHGYASALGSVAIATAAQHFGKPVTVSEWGSGDTTGKDLSSQIMADIYLMRPVAWVIWQPDWPGLMTINYTGQSYTLNEAYYVYEQFTKFIRPGFQFLAIGDANSLAAYNAQTKTLVIVTNNWTTSSRAVTYQLKNFTSTGSSASIYRTSSTEQFASVGTTSITSGSFSYAANANSVTTYVIANASYAPSATSVNDATTGTGNNEFNYSGTWSSGSQGGAYDADNHWSSATGNYYTFQFTGQQARVYASMATNGGIAAFSVDNGAETYFDTYAASRTDNVFLYATPTLGQGTHTLKVRVTGLKDSASTGYNVSADRIDVVSGGTEVGQDIYKIVNLKNGLDLEVSGASLADGGTVNTYADVSGANNEHWNLMAIGDGSYRIVNVNSGLDLEVSGANKSNGATVDQWQDSGSTATNEHWNLIAVGDGSYRIVNVNSGLDLEVNGTSGVVDQWADSSGAKNEHWTLTLEN